MSRVRAPIISLLFGTVVLTVLTGCSGVYFNTTFNAEKAYKQGLALKAERLRRAPDDSVNVTSEERAKFTRSITKSSKVLELWPDHPKYAPLAVYRIAECQYLMEDYGSAAVKYQEFLRYFPQDTKVPMARVRLAQTYFRDNKMLSARERLAEVLATKPTGEVRREALLLDAQLRIADRTGQGSNEGENGAGGGVAALAVYEQLLSEGAFETSEARNQVHWRAARLAYDLGLWEKARFHALASEEGAPPMRVVFRNQRLAVLSLYELGRYSQGLSEVRAVQGKRPYRPFRADLKLLEARGVEGGKSSGVLSGDWPAARRLYRETARLGPSTPPAAEAWYRVGAHLLDIENREDSARVFFDSAVYASRGSEFGAKAVEMSASLKRLAELRLMDSAALAELKNPPRDSVQADSAKLADSLRLAKSSDSTGVDSTAVVEKSSSEVENPEEVDGRAVSAAAAVAAKKKGKDVKIGGSGSVDKGDKDGKAEKPKVVIPKPPTVHFAPFMIAELFHFRLPKPDSARKFLNRIVADTAEDSVYSRRAFYAMAYIEEQESNKTRADSLYRALMTRYPATEWAKAAEVNLGLPATVRTSDDSARTLFLAAESRRFAGEDLKVLVTPAYREVVTKYPRSTDAAKAQFAIAFLTEESALAGQWGPPGRAVVDTVKAEYIKVRDSYKGTLVAVEAVRKIDVLTAAVDGSSTTSSGARGSGQGSGEEDYEEESSGSAVNPREEKVEDASEQDLY